MIVIWRKHFYTFMPERKQVRVLFESIHNYGTVIAFVNDD
jgi:hypothetical protein